MHYKKNLLAVAMTLAGLVAGTGIAKADFDPRNPSPLTEVTILPQAETENLSKIAITFPEAADVNTGGSSVFFEDQCNTEDITLEYTPSGSPNAKTTYRVFEARYSGNTVMFLFQDDWFNLNFCSILAAGTYKLNVPEQSIWIGSRTLGRLAYNTEINQTFTIPGTQGNMSSFTVFPLSGGNNAVGGLGEVTLNFDNVSDITFDQSTLKNITITDRYGSTTGKCMSAKVRGSSVTLTFEGNTVGKPLSITTANRYKLYIPKGTFSGTSGGQTYSNNATQIIYNTRAANPLPSLTEYEVTPSADAVTSLSEISVTFPKAVNVLNIGTTGITLTYTDKGGNTKVYTPKSQEYNDQKTLTLTFANDDSSELTAAGTYALSIPAGYCSDRYTTSAKSAAITKTFTIKAIEAEKVTLDATAKELFVGDSFTLTATVSPADAADKTVAWSSSNTDVATVDANGKVTAVAVGQATITATCGSVSATCAVTAKPILATGVTLDVTAKEMLIGDSFTLTATVAPENTTDKTVSWTSSNTEVATVDANGKVTAVAVGNATITASCGSVSATCAVTVKPILATGVTLDATEKELLIGESFTLTATVAPENTTDKTVVWSSSNTDVATVDANGKVTAVAVGNATITASCGSVSATCAVTVNPILATGVTLDATEKELFIGDSFTLTATVAPENTTDKTVSWTSSNTEVATVDADGKVTAVAVGDATITAACGSVSATCAVTVKPILATEVTIIPAEIAAKVGDQVQLTATVMPENTTDKTIVWTSSDETVATIDATGLVTILKAAECDITAACGLVSATCHVEATAGIAGISADGEGIVRVSADCLAVTGITGAYTLNIYGIDGICRATYSLEGNSTVNIEGLVPGIYIARTDKAGVAALRFVK